MHIVVISLPVLSAFSYSMVYRELERTITSASPQEDLKWFSNNHGPDMHMNWPQFEVQNCTEKRNNVAFITYLKTYYNILCLICIYLCRSTTQTWPIASQRKKSQRKAVIVSH